MQVGGRRVESHESGTFTVSGDTHGQFFDFIRIFSNDIGGGLPSRSNRFLFNGDMVDRGKEMFSYCRHTNTPRYINFLSKFRLLYYSGRNAVEIVLTLLLMKLVNPESLYILRGNHESIEMNSNYGFKKEVLRKYDLEIFQVTYNFYL